MASWNGKVRSIRSLILVENIGKIVAGHVGRHWETQDEKAFYCFTPRLIHWPGTRHRDRSFNIVPTLSREEEGGRENSNVASIYRRLVTSGWKSFIAITSARKTIDWHYPTNPLIPKICSRRWLVNFKISGVENPLLRLRRPSSFSHELNSRITVSDFPCPLLFPTRLEIYICPTIKLCAHFLEIYLL